MEITRDDRNGGKKGGKGRGGGCWGDMNLVQVGQQTYLYGQVPHHVERRVPHIKSARSPFKDQLLAADTSVED